MQDDNNKTAIERTETLYAIVREKLQELEAVHNEILENARRRVAQEQMNKLTKTVI